MSRIIFTLGILVALQSAALPVAAQCTQPAVSELVAFVQTHRQTPEEYVIGKFADHDVVILGEFHRIKHDQQLVQRLIPLLYKNGIYVLGWEFARAADQPLIDSLLTGREWDEKLGRRILFNMGVWGYQDYLDVLKAAWSFNRTLKPDQRPFRVLGINCDSDYSVFKTQADRNNPELIKRAFHDCTEENWAGYVLEQVTNGHKVLVHCGTHHAFTRYKQPVVGESGEFIRVIPDVRLGEALYQKLGDRVFFVSLHSPWYKQNFGTDYCRPVDGVIDSVMALAGPTVYPIGFDVVGSPFACMGDSASAYRVGHPAFKLADYCDGYIFQEPFATYQVTTWIDDFVNEANVDEARRTHYNLWYRDKKVGDFKKSMNRQLEREVWWYQHLGGE